jgi:hypothetical protein
MFQMFQIVTGVGAAAMPLDRRVGLQRPGAEPIGERFARNFGTQSASCFAANRIARSSP